MVRKRPATVAFELPEELGVRVDALLASGRRIEAVKQVRLATGAGLVVATRAVDHRAAKAR